MAGLKNADNESQSFGTRNFDFLVYLQNVTFMSGSICWVIDFNIK